VVELRLRKPCLRFALILLGWNVRFIGVSSSKFSKNIFLRFGGLKTFLHSLVNGKKNSLQDRWFIFFEKKALAKTTSKI